MIIPFFGGGFGRGGGGWRSSRRGRGSGPVGCFGCGTGCLTTLILIFVLCIVLAVLFSVTNTDINMGSDVTRSTVKREPLPRGSVVETEYYTDELDWIENRTELTTGMRNFYDRTGVQPHLYITDIIDGSLSPDETQVEAFAYDKYNALFKDEAHLLLIFFDHRNEYDSYNTWYLCGSQAKAVLDNEAMDILLDYIDRYYYDQNLSIEEFFSKAFDDASKRMMEVTTSPWVKVWIVIGLAALMGILFLWWRRAKQQKNLEAEQTKTILETPLESFGDSDINRRAEKYRDDRPPPN